MENIYAIFDVILPFEWANFNFMKNAFLSILIIAPLFGLIGTMIVNNNLSFFSDALGHSALTGIAIGVMMGIDNYVVSMLGFAILFALAISMIIESGISSADSIVGVFSSLGVALGVVLLSINGGFSKYSNYLIGDILAIRPSDIRMLFIVFIFVIIIWAISFNRLMISSLNIDLASSKMISPNFYKTLFMIIISIIVTVSIKWVGILIINSLLVLPAVSAKNLVKGMRLYHLFSVLISLFSGLTGLIASYYLGTSASGTIVLISASIFFVSFIINRIRVSY